jgi:hypothetical protein
MVVICSLNSSSSRPELALLVDCEPVDDQDDDDDDDQDDDDDDDDSSNSCAPGVLVFVVA